MQSVQKLPVGHGGLQRDERRPDGFDGMPEGMGQSVSVTRGTCGRVGGTSRTENDGRGFRPSEESLFRLVIDAAHPVAEQQYLADGRMADYLHARLPTPLHECFGDIPRLAAFGEYASALFGGEPYPEPLEEFYECPVVELRIGRGEELPVGLYLCEELFGGSDIRQVAASLACDAYFACGFLHLFQQDYFRSGRGGGTCRHESGSPAADYDEVVFHMSV